MLREVLPLLLAALQLRARLVDLRPHALRLAEHAVVVAGGSRNYLRAPTAEGHLLTGGRWLSIAPMSGPRSSACSVVLDGELWVLGGRGENGRALPSVEVWNPQANSWRSSPSFRQARSWHVGGVVGGSLVIAGGYGDFYASLASAEAFSPATGWTSLPPMPRAAYLATAVVLGGRLYVAGGLGCDKLQMWDGTAWTLKADLPAKRYSAASVAVDGKMWVIGGYVRDEGDTASVIIYDPETDSWMTGVPLPEPRKGCRATVHTGSILLAGDRRKKLKSTMALTPKEVKTWKSLTLKPKSADATQELGDRVVTNGQPD